MNINESKPSEAELIKLNEKILYGAVNRASSLSYVYCLAFLLYSYTSFQFIKQYDPTLTLFHNTWPRILFNCLPFFALGLFFSNFRLRTQFRSWLWTIGFPIIFLGACLIHVWPLMLKGHTDIYLYVHSANIFILSTSLIIVAPPLNLILAQIIAFLVLFLAPLTYIFLKTDSHQMLQFVVGDFALALPIAAFLAYQIHKLRLKIALFDLELKKIASPFLGDTLTKAIYDQKLELLENRISNGIVVQIDIRGYTQFYKDNEPEIVKPFTISFHRVVSKLVGDYGGYWHKSVGDSHIISFGVMDFQEDLSAIIGKNKELEAALVRRKKDIAKLTFKALFAIVEAFNEIKESFLIVDNIDLGIGVASGDIEIRIQGDDSFRQELDVEGMPLIKAARLEEYSKLIRDRVAPNCSVIAVAPEFNVFLKNDENFKIWKITDNVDKVRDFPEIQEVYYLFTQGKKMDASGSQGAA